MVIYIVLTFVDFQLFVEKCWKWLVAFDVGFILLLLTPLGKESGGNRNWLALDRIIPHFPLDLQPNEIVKIPFILLLAWQPPASTSRSGTSAPPSPWPSSPVIPC